MVVPLGAALLFLLGVGPALPWGRASREALRRALVPPLIGAAVLVVGGVIAGVRNPWTLLTLAFGGYALQVTIKHLFKSSSVTRAAGRRHIGAYLIHLGAAIAIIAIAVSSSMRTQQEITLTTGQSAKAGPYTLTFIGTDERSEPHRASRVATIAVAKNNDPVTTLEPRMNQYEMMREPIGTPDVYSTIGGDLYVSIASLESTQVALLVIRTPLVSWIWGAVILMAVGGLICIVPLPTPLTRPSTTLAAGEARA
jgi:cytochrome c-type biogenesis protein CcmF